MTFVPARPCLAASCCITRARFAGGGGGVMVPPSSLGGLASSYVCAVLLTGVEGF